MLEEAVEEAEEGEEEEEEKEEEKKKEEYSGGRTSHDCRKKSVSHHYTRETQKDAAGHS
jgi:hypothetical protein